MLRNRIVHLAVAAAALAILPIAAIVGSTDAAAQGAPPQIGMVLFGPAPTGAVEGQKVTAIVVTAGQSTRCGSGEVINSNGLKYVVRVLHESGRPGCGATGRFVTLYFGPANGQPGRLSTNSISWLRGPAESTVTLGDPLPVRGYALTAAKDGVR
jgi:hypothetical protein